MSLIESSAEMIAAKAKVLDEAATRGHAAMFEGELPPDGIERALWRQVVRAILETPGLMIKVDDIKRMTEETMERTAKALRAEFDKELIGYAEVFEQQIVDDPHHPDVPGLRVASGALRKVVQSS